MNGRTWWTPRRRWTAAALVLAVVLVGAVVLAARPDSPDGGLRVEAGIGTGVQNDRPYVSLHAGDLCLTGAPLVRLIGVEPVRSTGGAMITGFSVSVPGSDDASSPNAATAPRHLVRAACDQDEPASLVVEVHRPEEGTATIDGVRILYRQAGEAHIARSDVRMQLCAATGPCADAED